MSYSELDKSYGLAVWHVEDYLALIQKNRRSVSWTPRDIPGIDYVPYENVLPNESKFAAEYAALPSGQRVELTGELLKEAKSWGLSAAWPDKTDFVRKVRECRKNRYAIPMREARLKRAIEAIRHRLRTPDNHKTIAAFVVQNGREVAQNTKDLLFWVSSGGLPFLPNVDLGGAAHYGVIHPKGPLPSRPPVSDALRPKVEPEVRHNATRSKQAPDVMFKRGCEENSVRFSIAKEVKYHEPLPRTFAERVTKVAENQRRQREVREEGLLRRVWRFLFGA